MHAQKYFTYIFKFRKLHLITFSHCLYKESVYCNELNEYARKGGELTAVFFDHLDSAKGMLEVELPRRLTPQGPNFYENG